MTGCIQFLRGIFNMSSSTNQQTQPETEEKSTVITTPSFFEEGKGYHRPEWMKRKTMTIDEILKLSKDAANLAVEDSIRERRAIGLL